MSLENTHTIKAFLASIGLDEKEAKVYLYLLSHGPQNVSVLAKACGLTRTHGYDVASKLEKRGLCFNLGSLYGRKIKANPPAHMLEILKQKENEVSRMKHDLEEILPLFKSLATEKAVAPSRVSYFKGSESVRKMFFATLEEKEVLRMAGSEIDLIESLGEEFVANLYEKRRERGTKLQLLLPENRRGKLPVFNEDKKYLKEVHIRPKNLIRLKSNLVIWEGHVAFVSLKDEIFGTLIENEPLAVMLATWFDFIWSASKKVSQK